MKDWDTVTGLNPLCIIHKSSKKVCGITKYLDNTEFSFDHVFDEKEDNYKTIGKKNFNFQINSFNSNAQPFYVLLDPRDEKVLVEPKAYDTNINNFINFLNRGLDEYFDK